MKSPGNLKGMFASILSANLYGATYVAAGCGDYDNVICKGNNGHKSVNGEWMVSNYIPSEDLPSASVRRQRDLPLKINLRMGCKLNEWNTTLNQCYAWGFRAVIIV